MHKNDIIATVAANKKCPWRSAFEGLGEFEIEAWCDEEGVTLRTPEAVYAMPADELVKWAEGRAAEIEAVMGELRERSEASGDYADSNSAMGARETYDRLARGGDVRKLRACFATWVGLRGVDLELATFGDEGRG